MQLCPSPRGGRLCSEQPYFPKYREMVNNAIFSPSFHIRERPQPRASRTGFFYYTRKKPVIPPPASLPPSPCTGPISDHCQRAAAHPRLSPSHGGVSISRTTKCLAPPHQTRHELSEKPHQRHPVRFLRSCGYLTKFGAPRLPS